MRLISFADELSCLCPLLFAFFIFYEHSMFTSGLEIINFDYSLKLKIQRNYWLLADTCPQAANHCALFCLYSHMYASSESNFSAWQRRESSYEENKRRNQLGNDKRKDALGVALITVL